MLEKIKTLILKNKIKITLGLFILLNIIFILTTVILFKKVEQLERTVLILDIDNDLKNDDILYGNSINITTTSFQKLNDDFSIAIKSVEPHLSGLKLKGLIVNKSSVVHTDLKFKINNYHTEVATLSLNNAMPGQQANFEIYIPDITNNTKFLKFLYIESLIHYSY